MNLVKLKAVSYTHLDVYKRQVLELLSNQVQRVDYNLSEYLKKMLDVMEFGIPYSTTSIMEMLGLKSRETFRKNYLNPAIKLGLVVRTIPNKPNSRCV